jgi:hypothetical protein
MIEISKIKLTYAILIFFMEYMLVDNKGVLKRTKLHSTNDPKSETIASLVLCLIFCLSKIIFFG